MFFNRNYIPAVPIREEQRLSEEEELARQLKREARIFFPDRKLPDFDAPDLPDLPNEQQEADTAPSSDSVFGQKSQIPERGRGRQRPEPRDTVPDPEDRSVVLKDHDVICREEDSMWRKPDGTFSHHEVEAAREEAEQIEKNRQRLQTSGQINLQPAENEIELQMGETSQSVQPRLNKQDVKRGIRLQVILDKPRAIMPWKGDIF